MGGLGGVATAVGPFLGGWFISAVSWRLIFFINLPVAVAVLAVSPRHVPESKDPTMTGRLDIPGAALFSLALAGLTYGLTEGASLGWGSPVIVGSLLAGAALLVAFCVVELAAKIAVVAARDLPLRLSSRVRTPSPSSSTPAWAGPCSFCPFNFRQVLGFSPLEAGISLLPITVIMLALSARSGALAARIGPRLQMSVGPLFVAAGLALLARVGVTDRYVPGSSRLWSCLGSAWPPPWPPSPPQS